MCFKGAVITAQYNLYTYRELYVLYMREMTLGNWHCLMMHQGKEKLQTTYEEKKGSTQNMMTVMNFVLMCSEKLLSVDFFRAATIVLREDNCHFLRVDKEDFNRILRV